MLPREKIAHLPTPIEMLPRLTDSLGGPQLLIKRDDQTGLAFGGNKTRKLEYLLADARAQGARRVLTTGAAQSNHCRQTAAAAARCGLGCTLVLVGPEPVQPSGNYFLDTLLGAEIIWTDQNDRDRTLADACHQAEKAGHSPYLIPYGGSNSLGAYAYYRAYQEMHQQLENELPDWIVIASSSGGTQAGLTVGQTLMSGPQVLGISVDPPEERLRRDVAEIAESVLELIGREGSITPEQILVNEDYIGAGYGILTAGDIEAVHIFAEVEGILLDPVYTGRAAAGLLDLIRKDFFKPSQRVLFWHTGGTPGLFADRYRKDL